MATVHWGSMPSLPDTDSGIAAIEREQITKPRSMELDDPLLYQPSQSDNSASQKRTFEYSFGNSLVSQTIALNQFMKKIKVAISSIHQQGKSAESANLQSTFAGILAMRDVEVKEAKESKPYLEDKISSEENFRRGIGEPCEEIDAEIAKKLLKKSLAVMCAHAGFESTTESVLDTLVDVLHEYFIKITHLLRFALDREAASGGTHFPDVMEQVLYEIGVGGAHKLLAFYKTRVIDYRENVLKACTALNKEYDKLTAPESELQSDDFKNIKVKQQLHSAIQFPVAEELEDVAHTSEVSLPLDDLHTLHSSLEHEPTTIAVEEDQSKTTETCTRVNVAGLESEDDEIVNVIDSPVQASNLELIASEQQYAVQGSDSVKKVVKHKKKGFPVS